MKPALEYELNFSCVVVNPADQQGTLVLRNFVEQLRGRVVLFVEASHPLFTFFDI
jgi:hypothetical protein